MDDIPLSLHALSLLAAARRSNKRDIIIREALAILQDDTASRTTLNAEFTRLVDLGIFRKEAAIYVLTERAQKCMKSNALRLGRVHYAIVF